MNWLKFWFAVLLVQCIGSSYGQRNKKYFRKDYSYVKPVRSFYKFNTIQRTWQEAKRICEREGARLFYPIDEAECNAIGDLWKQKLPSDIIFVGASDSFGIGIYETIDGTPITDVFSKFSPGQPDNAGGNENCIIMNRNGTMYDEQCDRKYPFVCKKTLASLEWNRKCSTPYSGYDYNEMLGKCYKFSLTPKDWDSAYALCKSELSYLTVIDSQMEANYLVNITEQAPKDEVKGDYLRGVVHVGFHNKFDQGWKTIQDVTLTDSGYSEWAINEPNGGDFESCGSMYYNGRLNDVGCFQKCLFICEHDVDATIDKRCTADAHC